jgi:hypothetical protein
MGAFLSDRQPKRGGTTDQARSSPVDEAPINF